jgi:hypothetical protein
MRENIWIGLVIAAFVAVMVVVEAYDLQRWLSGFIVVAGLLSLARVGFQRDRVRAADDQLPANLQTGVTGQAILAVGIILMGLSAFWPGYGLGGAAFVLMIGGVFGRRAVTLFRAWRLERKGGWLF